MHPEKDTERYHFEKAKKNRDFLALLLFLLPLTGINLVGCAMIIEVVAELIKAN